MVLEGKEQELYDISLRLFEKYHNEIWCNGFGFTKENLVCYHTGISKKEKKILCDECKELGVSIEFKNDRLELF